MAGRRCDDELVEHFSTERLIARDWTAADAALSLAFGACGVTEVLAVVYPDNAKSIAVCRRLGMTHLGQTDRFYGVAFELFRLRADAQPGAG